ncbi:phosphocholine cytidylyltransferase family protein [Clostridium sp. Marseille-QA1073]
MNFNKAIIVAAGLGSRLGDLTKDTPKPLLKIGEDTIIERNINTLKKNGIEDIGIVVGYKKEKIMELLGDSYTYIFNPFYENTNNMASLWFAKDFVRNSNFIYCHSDIIYEEYILKKLLNTKGDIVLSVEEKRCDGEAMKVLLTDNTFVKSSKDISLEKAYGEWIGMARFSHTGWNLYFKYIEELLYNKNFKVYDTEAMNNLVKDYIGFIKISSFTNLKWYEIDFYEDYIKAINMFKSNN